MFGTHDAIGIDELHAGGHGFDLGLPERAGERVELAIDVADADVVEVHKGELTDTGAREGFDGPRTDAANADDADVRLAQAFLSNGAIEPEDAAKSSFVIRHCGSAVIKICDNIHS